MDERGVLLFLTRAVLALLNRSNEQVLSDDHIHQQELVEEWVEEQEARAAMHRRVDREARKAAPRLPTGESQ